ncbi:DUF6281 family protein [Streptomyces sp. NPDC048717]|uniref:DUF6281 family protein n=1 Tax=unclassified Streptomyces TaxID=2593676 RepID=UPI003449E4B9
MEAKPRVRRWTRALAVVAVLAGVGTGCDDGLRASDAGEGASETKCAYVVTYEGRSYLDVRGRSETGTKFTVGKDLGTGLLPGCEESGGAGAAEKPEKVTVFEVKGVDPAVAVAAGPNPGEAVLVAVEGADLTSLDAAS